MTTKTYYLDTNAKGFAKIIQTIKKTIPCFYQSRPVEMDYAECSFTVRVEDVPFVEAMIAPIV